MSQEKVLITGTSSGLGLAFAEYYLQQGYEVYGLSRRGCPIQHPRLHDMQLDMGDLPGLEASLSELLKDIGYLDLLILNAGILGKIEPMSELKMDELKQLMDINVWANKLMLDYVCEGGPEVAQIVAISSGAAVNGNKGWGAYSLSKAALNMLIKLYAAEYPQIHFSALAPGLVDTRMQDFLCDQASVDESEFPSVKKLRQARGTEAMPSPAVAAKSIAAVIPTLKGRLTSGDFVDMRNL